MNCEFENYSLNLESGKKIYFASDTHLGLHATGKAADRERKFALWLDEIKNDAQAIFLLGDIFDFWFEYKHVVPRGFTRVLGKIAEITDSGIPVHFFTGNHDMWTFDYLTSEVGVCLHKKPCEFLINDKIFFLAHGDGIGKGDKGYKRLKNIFACRFLQRCFAFLHPWVGMSIAHRWSNHSRLSKGLAEKFDENSGKEFQLNFAKEYQQTKHIDFFVFGHRHTPIQLPLANNSLFTILGEWISGCEYAVYDGENLNLTKFT